LKSPVHVFRVYNSLTLQPTPGAIRGKYFNPTLVKPPQLRTVPNGFPFFLCRRSRLLRAGMTLPPIDFCFCPCRRDAPPPPPLPRNLTRAVAAVLPPVPEPLSMPSRACPAGPFFLSLCLSLFPLFYIFLTGPTLQFDKSFMTGNSPPSLWIGGTFPPSASATNFPFSPLKPPPATRFRVTAAAVWSPFQHLALSVGVWPLAIPRAFP